MFCLHQTRKFKILVVWAQNVRLQRRLANFGLFVSNNVRAFVRVVLQAPCVASILLLVHCGSQFIACQTMVPTVAVRLMIVIII